MRPPGISRLAYRVYAVVINLLVTLLFPCSLLARLLFTTNMAGMCENLTITITDIVANLKFANVYLVKSHLYEIRSLLRLMDARARRIGDPEELRALKREVDIARGSFRVFARIFVFGTALSCFRLVIRPDRELLYPAWFGVDWMHSTRNYVFINLYQLFGLVVQAVQNCASDSYPPAFLCLLTGHMRALELRVRRIGYRAEGLTGNDDSWREEVYEELVECIRDLMRVHQLRKIIQRILSVPCMAQFACSAAVQCTVAMHFLYMADDNDLTAMIISIVFFTAHTYSVEQ